ncbi:MULTISPECIES: hypothetical protein, partial [unclassified Caballeronia]|uniref:hypothetical protein n=1 Tax=unclassified Caballeronia TaxID=2646786 RepID=UPI00202775C5
KLFIRVGHTVTLELAAAKTLQFHFTYRSFRKDRGLSLTRPPMHYRSDRARHRVHCTMQK